MTGLFEKILSSFIWLPSYLLQAIHVPGGIFKSASRLEHVYFCFCDHFEPFWNNAGSVTALKRIKPWLETYPKIAEKYPDSDGRPLKYSFFYPEEEYHHDVLNQLADLCLSGYGEVEVHLHHDNDTSENLRKKLIDYKNRLYGEHGLLSRNKENNEISYGFIHGNWALDNSGPDGKWCGVNDEITVLQETGCFADFTMPSAPGFTQTRKINSLYYAVDDPERPKSHNTGKDVVVGSPGKGLLMVQGPLGLKWHDRKFGCIPRIENSAISKSDPPTPERIQSWIGRGIHVERFPSSVFVKVHTHGAKEDNQKMLIEDGGLETLLSFLTQYQEHVAVHFLSAREMANVIYSIEAGNRPYDVSMRDFRFILK